MVAGSSGSGKTTFINTLGDAQALPPRKLSTSHEPKTTAVETTNFEIDEDGTKITLSIVDTPGFGDNINNELSFQEILKYIEYQYDEVLAQESRIKRTPKFQDSRVHVCLYFISASGHSLREIDIDFMRRLSPRVNVLPVISKADSFTKSELQGFKKRIMDDLRLLKIPIYDFPVDPEEDGEELIEENRELRSLLPFAVIGSDGKMNDKGLDD
jgi:cell division control protein 11